MRIRCGLIVILLATAVPAKPAPGQATAGEEFKQPLNGGGMPQERSGLIKFGHTEVTVVGPDIHAGQPAPEFTVVNQDWTPFRGLADTAGKARVIAAVPSLVRRYVTARHGVSTRRSQPSATVL